MDAQDVYYNSELALAAYADLDDSNPTLSAANQQALKNAGMSDKQAQEFAYRYPEIVVHYPDDQIGFSATVFQSSSGKLTLAIRGTDGPFDLDDDVDVSEIGAAGEQITKLYNWWSLASVTGDLAVALSSEPIIDIAGHSLGGHLAMAFGSLFAPQAGEIYTFNAPGFKSEAWNQQLFESLVEGATVPTGVNTTNVIADEADIGDVPWSGVAGLYSRPGVPVNIAIENQWLSDEPDAPGAFNHSQQILTDSLAIYNLLSELDSSLSNDDYKAILAASVTGTAGSYEGIIDTLFYLIGAGGLSLPVGNAYRDDLYNAIYDLQDTVTFQSLAGFVTIRSANTVTASQAATDFSSFLSLYHLSPIYLRADASALSVLQLQHSTLFDSWTDGVFNEGYLKDRSAFLSMVLQRNSTDNTTNYHPADFELTSRAYYDATTGTFFYTGNTPPPLGLTDPHNLYSSSTQKIYFGTASVDNLLGGTQNDHLYGMAGNDTLNGGAGNDLLCGGLNDDTYIFNAGYGTDRIIDKVHQAGDSIQLNGININSYTFTSVDGAAGSYGLYVGTHASSAVPQVSLFYDGSGLCISVADGTNNNNVIVDYFTDGDFGISLGKQAAPEIPVTDVLVDDLGSTSARAFDRESTNQNGISWAGFKLRFDAATASGYNEGGYYGIAGGSFEGGRNEDYLTGSAGSNALDGFGGDDIIEGLGGNDHLTGGAGSDTIAGGEGNDLIWGSAQPHFETYLDDIATDSDFINGAAMAAYYADQFSDTLNDINTLDGGDGNDFVTGGDYSDVIKGGAGSNYLFGNTGNDLIEAGGERDIIYGDSAFDFSINSNGSLDPAHWAAVYEIAFADGNDSINNYNDIISAGDGDDRVWGELGDDIIYGQAGNDTLYGDRVNDATYFANEYPAFASSSPDLDESLHGKDVLEGGSGNDFLYGNGGDDTLRGGLDADWLDGGSGNDTYVFRGGDGLDTLIDESGDINLVFENIDPSSLIIQYQGDLASVSYLAPGSTTWDSMAMLKTTFDRASIAGVSTLNSINQIYRDDQGSVQFTIAGNSSATLGSASEQLQYSIDSNESGFTFNFDSSVNYLDITESNGVVTISSADFRFTGIEIEPGIYESVSISGQSPQFFIRTIGSDASDYLSGSNNSDWLSGFAGVDTIYGLGADDTLVGGTDNDFLYGGSGLDNYVFSLGDGQDVVGDYGWSNYWFDETVNAGDIKVVINDLQANAYSLEYSATDSIAISYSNGVSNVKGVYHNDQLIRTVVTSSIENGYIEGTDGDDRFVGGVGSDTYYVESARDIYQFSSGDGQDVIALRNNSDPSEMGTIFFTADVDPASVSFLFGGGSSAESWIYYGNGDAIKLDQGVLHGNNYYDNPFNYFDFTFEADPAAPLVIDSYSNSNGAVYGSNGADNIIGSDDYDRIMPGKGQDVIDARGDDDVIVLTGLVSDEYSGAKDISGGQGNDQVEAALFQGNTYRYNPGDGFDEITYDIANGGNSYNWERSVDGVPVALITAGEDVIVFAAGIRAADVELNRSLDALNINLKDGSGGISISNFFTVYDAAGAYLLPGHPDWWYEEADNIFEDPYILQLLPSALVSGINFDDGSSLDIADYIAANPVSFANASTIYGSDDPANPDIIDNFEMAEGLTYYLLAGDDEVYAGDGDDIIYGGEGNDILYGGWGDNRLFGGAGNDELGGDGGDDLVVGEEGDDELYGLGGNDTYEFSRGFGNDELYLWNQRAGDITTLFFTSDIAESSVSGDREGDDLLLSVNNDSIRIVDYYLYSNGIDQVIFEGGNIWDAARLDDATSRYDASGNQVRSVTAAGNRYYAFDEANRQLFSIDEWGMVSEVRYDMEGNISDRLIYANSISSYLSQWILDNPGDSAPSASDISGMFADMAQDNGEYHRQLLANGDAHYALDNQQWDGGMDWSSQAESGYRRLQGMVAEGGIESPAINQRINLAAYGNAIDLSEGNLVLTVGGSDLSPSSIRSRWIVSFTDANGNAIGSVRTEEMPAGYVWTDHSFDVAVPLGARAAQLSLSAFTTTGKGAALPTPASADIPVYFDNLRVDAHLAGSTGEFNAEPDMSSRISYISYLSATEDAVKTLNATDLLVQAGAPGEVVVSFDSVSNGTNGSVEYDSATGQIKFTPADGFVGKADFSYTVIEDGVSRVIDVVVNVAQSIYIGDASDDVFMGTAATDVVYGYAGNDELHGGAKADIIFGGADDDQLYGDGGNDQLFGDAGDDTLVGGYGSDTLTGGLGNDVLKGDNGSDTYVFNAGDGEDFIDNYSTNAATTTDKIRFGSTVNPAEVILSTGSSWGLAADDLIIDFLNSPDRITVKNFFTTDGNSVIDQITFSSNGSVWDESYIRDVVQMVGDSADNSLADRPGNNVVMGLAGNDGIWAYAGGNDVLFGGQGNDIILDEFGNDNLYGEEGDDTLYGWIGDDLLVGGQGSDLYMYSEGNDLGADTIDNSSSTWATDTDVLNFYGAAAKEDIWFTQQGDDLRVEFLGLDGSVTLSKWYSDTDNRVDELHKGTDILYASQVDALVQAMSAFSPQLGSGSNFDLSQQPELQQAIASAWTPSS